MNEQTNEYQCFNILCKLYDLCTKRESWTGIGAFLACILSFVNSCWSCELWHCHHLGSFVESQHNFQKKGINARNLFFFFWFGFDGSYKFTPQKSVLLVYLGSIFLPLFLARKVEVSIFQQNLFFFFPMFKNLQFVELTLIYWP